MTDLKPCPFCGKHGKYKYRDVVTCSNYDCPVWTVDFEPKKWNTRANTLHPERVDELAGWIKVKIRPGGETIIPATGYNGGVEAMARAIKRELVNDND